jgi:hypothetical protein
MSWTDANIDLLSRAVPISTLSPPALFNIDGTAAFRADRGRGVVFLFNPGPVPLSTTLLMDESIGLLNSTQPLVWTVSEEYPHAGQSWGVVKQGQSIEVGVPGSGVRVLSFALLDESKMVITNATGTASFNAGTLTLSNLTGVAGRTVTVCVALVPGPVSSVIVNGVRVQFDLERGLVGYTVLFAVTFAGGAFEPLQPVGNLATAARLTGPFEFTANVTLPSRVLAQWRARAAAYPVPWTADELAVSWLAPARPMLSIFFKAPKDSFRLGLSVDGIDVPVVPAYNSRALHESGCFLGFFADLSSTLTSPGNHTLRLRMLSLSPAGDFVGLFMDNVAYEYTAVLATDGAE